MWLLYGEMLALILASFAVGSMVGWLAVRVVVRKTGLQVLAEAAVEEPLPPEPPGVPG